MEEFQHPDAIDPAMVGKYPALAGAGGGFVWDAVLEYRVWCHPERGAPNECEGDDYYCSFATYDEALRFSLEVKGTESPLALVLQREYLEETAPGEYVHITSERITEWPVEFLRRPVRTP